MNKILYRAKSTKTNEWVYGLPISIADKITFLRTETNEEIIVDTKTLSQMVYYNKFIIFDSEIEFKLFEGDIIQVTMNTDNPDGWTSTSYEKYLCKWNEDFLSFTFYYIDDKEGLLNTYETWDWVEIQERGYVALIGNMWDNADLLRKGSVKSD